MEGRRRVVIEDVRPRVDDGAYPVKRAVGDEVVVEFDALADGHDRLASAVLYRRECDPSWQQVPAAHVVNDRWRATFTVNALGLHVFVVEAWVDTFGSWTHELEKRLAAGQDVAVELQIGSELVALAARRARGADASALRGAFARLREGDRRAALDPALRSLMSRYSPRRFATRGPERTVWVDRERGARSAWYKIFPRSFGTLRDVAEVVVPHAASLGFDILYLLPIHPIGTTERKGKDNTLGAKPGDPGSPYAIGSAEGGHTAIAPELGTLEDLHALVAACRERDMELALDIAFQCSPDHPWVREHPEWFRHRPDGTIMYAENPPKKYQDIYPFDMSCEAWRSLWDALRDVFLYWAAQGVRAFRVDNPHTKPFAFWDWCLAEVRREHPDAIFLAEAFTRPKVMRRLAKAGFTQSYTYFTWRTAKWELTEYLTELTTESIEYFRPNFWPNTPDILPFHLQTGGRPAFRSRAVLAATLAASWGVYAPAFELAVNTPLAPGREEYAASETYELRRWDLTDPASLAPLLARLNAIRREHPALWRDRGLAFHGIDNERLIAYSKRAGDDVILCVVSLEHVHTESGWTDLDLAALGVTAGRPFAVRDLLDGARYFWNGPRNFVRLAPGAAHIFEVER
ncbi:MAG TPA: maltotransferase domain-containing protein [Candidatus Limnocylindria bacterium]|nr:maltotransferase domain-containing protein [Candidatus Limnocylindria bacterium]